MKKFKVLLMALALLPNLVLAQVANQSATLYYPLTGNKLVIDTSRVDYIKKLWDLGYKLYNGNLLGGSVPASGVNWTLASPIGATDTKINLSSVTNIRGDVIPSSDMPTKIYLTIEPNNTASTEIIVCPVTGYSTSTKSFDSCTRGLNFSGTSESGVTSYKKIHSGGSKVIISDPGQFYNNFIDLDSSQTITGIKTFSVSPIVPTPTSDTQAANKKFVADSMTGLVGNASASVAGTTKLSTNPASSTNPIALNSEEVATTTSANKVVRANSSGYLDSSWLGSTQSYSLGSTTTVTGTLNVSATTTFTGLTKVATSTPTVAGQVVGLDSNAKLPAVDGSQLTMMATAGVVTDLATTTAGNNDVSVTLNFQPSIIKLYYFIQGHSPSTGYANYQAQKGVAIYNGNTLAGVYLDMSTNNLQYALTGDDGYYSISGSNPTFISNIPNSTTNPSVGAYSSAEGCRVELSIPTISSTGFTIRRQTSFVTSCSYTMRAKIMYEAYR